VKNRSALIVILLVQEVLRVSASFALYQSGNIANKIEGAVDKSLQIIRWDLWEPDILQDLGNGTLGMRRKGVATVAGYSTFSVLFVTSPVRIMITGCGGGFEIGSGWSMPAQSPQGDYGFFRYLMSDLRWLSVATHDRANLPYDLYCTWKEV